MPNLFSGFENGKRCLYEGLGALWQACSQRRISKA